MKRKYPIFFSGHLLSRKKFQRISPQTSSLKWIDFMYCCVGKRQRRQIALHQSEAIVCLLAGKIQVADTILGERKNVFDDKSHSYHVTGISRLDIQGVAPFSEYIVIQVPAKKNAARAETHIGPDDVHVKQVGKKAYRRSVHTIFKKSKQTESSNLIVGETYNEAGKWSSYPPHKHAKNIQGEETRFEELYFFKIRPSDRFGMIHVYTDRINKPFCVRNNDSVNVTEGYHPVCAAPGTQLYYFWVLFGKAPILLSSVDTAFRESQ